jgi:adenosine deaminase
LQDPDAVELAFENLGQELADQGVKYAEIRFAPQLHSVNVSMTEKLAWEDEIVQAAIRGINKVMMFNNIVINLILCCMRNLPDGQSGFLANARTVYLASKYLNKGVCAIDLAGAEARDATKHFEVFFETARDFGIPFTIHAGESGDPRWMVESIKSAIEFGATRIGHGVGLMHSEELREIVRDRNIAVECCLKSNLDTKAVESLGAHPIRSLFDDGIKVTLNTDNMTVSNTNLSYEYELASQMFSAEEIAKMQKYAFDAAFMTEAQRRKVKKMWL